MKFEPAIPKCTQDSCLLRIFRNFSCILEFCNLSCKEGTVILGWKGAWQMKIYNDVLQIWKSDHVILCYIIGLFVTIPPSNLWSSHVWNHEVGVVCCYQKNMQIEHPRVLLDLPRNIPKRSCQSLIGHGLPLGVTPQDDPLSSDRCTMWLDIPIQCLITKWKTPS